MSDLYSANDLRPGDAASAAGLSPTEQSSGPAFGSEGVGAGGFDVHAAAAEVWSTSSPGAPAAPAQRWTAADYGWDPADPNAVAWAAYYSDQGLDPAAVAAQQAAGDAPASDPEAVAAPISEHDLAAERLEPLPPLDFTAPLADPEAALEVAPPEPEPMPELDFAPVDELDLSPAAAEGPPASPVVPGAHFEAAASSLWDLLPAPDAVQPAAEQQAQLPGGWPGDDASGHIDEFHLAGGGSFDEPTAPLADLSPEQLVEAYPPGVDLMPDPDAFEAAAAPGPVSAPSAGSDGHLPIDLGEMDLEPAPQPAPVEPEVSIDLGFVEDEPVAGAPWEPLAASTAPAPVPADLHAEPDVGWAAELAVPAGDDGVDVDSFEAPPQPDEQPAVRDGTAMWGLAGSRGATETTPQAFAAPLPQDDPWDAPAEPQGAPLTPLELEPDGFGPFDLGATDHAAQPMPLALLELPPAESEVLEATDEQILEVGEEVVEVAPANEPPLPAAEVAQPPVAQVVQTLTPKPPPPEPFSAPVKPAAAATADPAPAPISSYIAGPHRVVIHTADGQVKRGTVCDVALDGPDLLLQPQAGGAAETLPAERVKAIFFMLAAGEAPPAPAGKKVRVTFRDGRQVAGFSPDYLPERAGFFMIPVDTRTHTARIWVYRTSVRQVTIS